MSYQAVEWVFREAPMPKTDAGKNHTTARLVLAALADAADADGTNAYPAVSEITWRTGLSDKPVRNALKTLEQAGLIVRNGTKGDGVTNWTLRLHLKRPPEERAAHDAKVNAEREAALERMTAARRKRATDHQVNTFRSQEPEPRGHASTAFRSQEPEHGLGEGRTTASFRSLRPNVPVPTTERSGSCDGDTSPYQSKDQSFSPLRPPLGGTRSTGRAASSTASGGQPTGEAGSEVEQDTPPDAYDWADELADAEADAPPSRSVPSPTKDAEDERATDREHRSDTVPYPIEKRAEDAEDGLSGPEWTEIRNTDGWAAEAHKRLAPAYHRRYAKPEPLARLARRANKGDRDARRALHDLGLVAS
ncbi:MULTISPECIES: helix-turn-helix domain-containing protein [Amycolatopsis]|uniref:helix-turn-helix domain-containing protein n=1 Tax=Amycolatopsis TaxID=1813 RepID=UPI001F2B8AE3|nr:helix-turn-helix domain-containing protein [Amycolatopsis tucumanensis]MCF6425067.1 helix-turn-helix domain-containing protein [Amycolatopsis tucumanensis]